MPRPVTLCSVLGCGRAARARGYCSGHLSQLARGSPLAPLREVSEVRRVVLSLRVPAETKARALADPPGARAALERWARR